ncbi:G-D-S-L family lipolytic protein [Galbibacter pacificus]|uniref:G-D-S-L family lipolytic protein n=1 Tax=Galbibacter pacificus TaxID=2996052 RepID=A0ABT6FT76_9FLAO|nr:G-D-S-L family lipolytic protein [Galbibacter pacificus]MDG3582412.1 G-D-S-L family lipolytic protein [Galbibacter pacificus]MDG3586470.1 G-D-S-L family lipolytic protein [Galbibacter pacificus]
MKKLLYISLAAITFTACQPEFNDPVNEQDFYTNGDADFSNYVSVGNSLTAGFADNALYLKAQQNSYPAIMAGQFGLAGGGDFIQPLVDGNLGGLLNGGQIISGTRLVLQIDAEGNRAPVSLEGTPTTDITNHLDGPFNNMGIPGAKSFHLLAPGYGNIAGVENRNANPYFVRIASSTDATVIGDAVAQDPTFFSLWIGSNDILSYASQGGDGEDQTGNTDPTTYGYNDITDPNVFASVYNEELKALTSTGAKGVVANVPEVTSIAYFTTVPYNAIPLDTQTAEALNQAYAPYNAGLQQVQAIGLITAEEAAQRTIQFSAGQNPVVLLDEDLTDLTTVNPALTNMRQATEEDLIPLPVSSVLGTLADPDNPQSVIGVGVPLNDAQVLTITEQTHVSTAQTAYNTTIKALADQYDLAFVDVNAILKQLANGGVPFDGGTITADFGTGGAFSLDGVHLTQRGYAVVANAFIDAINKKYNATVPKVNPGNYPTIFVK